MNPTTASRLAELHTALAAVYADLAQQDPSGSDSVLSLRDAAIRLGVTESWLCRREAWQKVGGFKGPDGRVKFAESALRVWLNAQKR